MTTPMPPNNTGDKTRKQLITILVLLVLIILAMVVFLITKISGDRGGDSAAAEGGVSSSSESNAVVADDNGAGSSAGDDGGPNPTAGQQASGSGSDSGSQSGASDSDSSPQGSSNGTSGQQTVTGTVKVFQNRAEVLAYQQREDPNPHTADNRQFAILVLDQPTEVTAKLAGSNETETRTIDHVVINPNRHSDGERATISFSTDKTYWPSDTGIPFGLAVEDGAKY